jgi:hypothetical protein
VATGTEQFGERPVPGGNTVLVEINAQWQWRRLMYYPKPTMARFDRNRL